MKRVLIFFAAGCLGAFANSVVVWLFGDLGISKSLGVSISHFACINSKLVISAYRLGWHLGLDIFLAFAQFQTIF